MRVRCVDNSYQSLPSTSIFYTADHKNATFSLDRGKEYVVYAIWIRGVEILYSILNDELSRYPMWFPSDLFVVEDGRLPTSWRYGAIPSYDAKSQCVLIAFPEWIGDQTFNEKVVDGEPDSQAVWQRYKLQIAAES